MTLLRRGLCLLAILVPLSLLAQPRAIFYPPFDWNNNLWLIAYFAEFFRHHLGMPAEINLVSAAGMTMPLFYGYLLYPVLGLLAVFVGADLALRLGCLALVALQFYALLCAGREVFRHRGLAYAVAATVVWSTYALTDLYNRSAIAEYFATGFLMAAIGFGVAAAAAPSGASRPFYAWMAGVASILAIGIHPPTAAVSGVFLAAAGMILAGTWIAGARSCSRLGIVGSATGAGLGLLILAPWFYLTLRIGPRLAMWSSPFPMFFYPTRSDSWIGRLSPLPYDWLSARWGTLNVSTPYLEAPVAFGLLILLGWLMVVWLRSRPSGGLETDSLWARAARMIVPAALAWFGLLFALSVSQAFAARFLFLGPYLQFAYRLVSHLNAALLMAVFAVGALAGMAGALARRRAQADLVAAVCITVAAMALGVKLEHANTVRTDRSVSTYPRGDDRAPLVADGSTYLVPFYAAPAAVAPLEETQARDAMPLNFPVGRTGDAFGRVDGAQIHLARPGWVLTNAVVFPWSRVWVDGVRAGGDNLRRAGAFYAVRLPAGTAHLRWEWHPDPIWSWLHAIGQFAFAALLAITALWALVRALGGRRGRSGGKGFVDPLAEVVNQE
jgi:hypothetical protein